MNEVHKYIIWNKLIPSIIALHVLILVLVIKYIIALYMIKLSCHLYIFEEVLTGVVLLISLFVV